MVSIEHAPLMDSRRTAGLTSQGTTVNVATKGSSKGGFAAIPRRVQKDIDQGGIEKAGKGGVSLSWCCLAALATGTTRVAKGIGPGIHVVARGGVHLYIVYYNKRV